MAADGAATISVGLEEAADGATLVHALSVPGCVASGLDRDAALAAFPAELAAWLDVLEALGEPVPARNREIEIAVDEWVVSNADVAAGASEAFFEADEAPISDGEIERSLRLLGDLRGALLAHVRRRPDAELDRVSAGGWSARRSLEELARAQWWLLSRLGASPLAELPDGTIGRLDTAMALTVQRFTVLPRDARGRVVELDDELWSPRKVLRRLLWLEWTLGRVARDALAAPSAEPIGWTR